MNTKLSQINAAVAPPALGDQLVGVKGGAIDQLFTLSQVQTVIGGSNVAAINSDYVAVPASTSNQILGTTGAIGDYLAAILVVPASTAPGAITVKDGVGGASITVFAGGTDSVTDLTPFILTLGLPSRAVGWFITVGTSVSVVAAGNFT